VNKNALAEVLPAKPQEMTDAELFIFKEVLHFVYPGLVEIYEERAAIMEFDGGMSRGQAERLAAILVRYMIDQLILRMGNLSDQLQLFNGEKDE